MKAKLLLLTILGILLTAFIFSILFFGQNHSYQTLNINNTEIRVLIADTPLERQRGLGGRNSLAENEGMLFIFDDLGIYPFWMKDVKFPLDMIWINDTFRIIHIEHNVAPETYPKTFVSQTPAQYVLEVNAGFTIKNQINIGDTARIEQ